MAAKTESPMTGDELQGFIEGVLAGIGAPATAWNLKFMTEWAKSEGTAAAHNPFASERPATGSTTFNSAGVRNYTDDEQGIAATVETLKLSYYRAIVHALQTQTVADREGIVKGLETWSGTSTPHAYHVAALIHGGWTPGGARTQQAQETAVGGATRPVASAHARQAAKDAALGAPAASVWLGLLITEASNGDLVRIFEDVGAHHWAAAVGAFIATPLAAAVWRAIKRWSA